MIDKVVMSPSKKPSSPKAVSIKRQTTASETSCRAHSVSGSWLKSVSGIGTSNREAYPLVPCSVSNHAPELHPIEASALHATP